MADLDYYGADYGAEAPSRVSDALRNFGLANWAGAATSLALAGGMAVWAVDLTMRDMSRVPVIAAMEGPMRVAPADPGGMQAKFQGMALSDITSGGPAAPAPEEIVLAPAPVDLSAPPLAERRVAAGLAPLDPVREALTASAAEPAAIATPTPADVATLAEPPAPAPVPEAVVAVIPEPEPEPEPEIEVAEVYTGPGIALSSRPEPRPKGLARRVPTEAPLQQPTTQVASLGGGTLDVDPSTLEAGTRVVQLGAYDSRDAAMGEWDRLSTKFSAYMGDKRRLVQKARSGGRDFWRLRVVGFEDGADARRFCSALLAKDAACIPVTVR
ncbi:SPOR domain-containing protein [Jannaschia seohaensis]|uniref:Sporulation related domain-containing protein n=1 Tax=Jannaschia seohaensis TaxID=475081 RepID=A0A2Y9AWE6_9RHOB|nr:SPOR domain-containing protein [Jannaschia seohaensis]PWJ18331.1 sporulation related protein [Jannaschia seohaensis]SSA46857.1 Sporulation related domain-containing protein [Jannaschia seohaensis]